MKSIILTSAFLALFAGILQAQPYVEGGNTRHRFAQLNLGANYRFLSNKNTLSYDYVNNELIPQQLNNQNEVGLIVGGTHFWGHADFYVLFPIAGWGKSNFSSGIETGTKIYPWRIENNKLRPFTGISLNAVSFNHGEGTTLSRTTSPLHFGFTFYKNQHLIDLSFSYNHKNEFNYYFNTLSAENINLHKFWFNIGFKYMLETTVGAEKGWKNGSTLKITEALSQKRKLNGFTLAVGPSSANFTSNSSFIEEDYPFLDNHKFVNLFPEFGVGYYWHKIDFHSNISYRNMKDELTAFGYLQKSSRRAITLEAFKFLSDYHGFAFFAGPAVSYEMLKSELKRGAASISKGSFNGIKPGITFGWDIRPNRIQTMVLRTNLRYFPNLDVTMENGKTISLDNLEFNFIQLVIYPGRMLIR
jgi:hypothetical protein